MTRPWIATLAMLSGCGATVAAPPQPADVVVSGPPDAPDAPETTNPPTDTFSDVPVDLAPLPDVVFEDTAPQCSTALTRCADTCVDLSGDEAHCGGCDRRCGAGEDCTGSRCVPRCLAPDISCPSGGGSVCVDTSADPLHCGGCGRACMAGQGCEMGVCALRCSPGQRACGNVCRAVVSDREHCGACANACAAGHSCVEGVCSLVCTTGETNCGGRCVNVSNSAEHCGDCERACPAGGRCVSALCTGTPCGPMDTPTGRCDGDAIVRCTAGTLARETCLRGQTCGVAPGAVPTCSAPADALRVSGRVTWQNRPVSPSGVGAPRMDPGVGLPIVVLDATDRVLAQGFTDATGAYALEYSAPAGSMLRVRMVLARSDTAYNFSVRAYEMGTHSFTSEPFTAAAAATRDMAITAAGNSGAIAIFMVIRRAFEFIQPVILARPAVLYVNWQRDRATGPTSTSSFFSGASSTISINGSSADPDEFDASVIAHEFGHYFQRFYSRTNSPGGAHNGTPTDPNLAFGEGGATFLGSLINDSPYYIDAGTTRLRIVVNIVSLPTSRSYVGDPTMPLSQALGEWFVAGSQHAIYRAGPDRDRQVRRAMNVLMGYLRRSPRPDRGEVGIDLVDYLDGYLCTNMGADRDTIMNYVVTARRFPYDFGFASVCR